MGSVLLCKNCTAAHEDNGLEWKTWSFSLLDERRALIRKFAIKGDGFGMKGINKVLTLVKWKY